MPRNVRNFWIEADIDGRKSAFASGPVRKDGGFELTIKMRSEGSIVEAISAHGWVDEQGNIRMWVRPKGAEWDGEELSFLSKR